ncbi:MAG: metalloregulator ArsR/SmtB family transcription factor [Thermaerobacter sp.]|nr:metalloregulator ArsR/SmtB family transcription factor [Thermaerobacter sp.]
MRQYKAQFFQALANPHRIQILEILRERPKTVSELQAKMGVEASNISQQLAILRKQHIVYGTKDGTSVIYDVKDRLVFEILDVSRKMFQNQLAELQSAVLQDTSGRGAD